MIKEFLKPQLEASDAKEVIHILGELLQKSGYVADTFIEAVLRRESSLPTGLQVGRLNVAIPHTDSTHVNQTTVALATLSKPVKFYLMEDPAKEIDVSIVFLIAVKEPKKQVELLKKLMLLFQNEELLIKIKNSENSQIIYDILTQFLV